MGAELKVLFLAAEADPFIKVGGLGDVAGSLPRALRALAPPPGGSSLDVRLALPLHGAIQRQKFELRPAATFTIQHASGLVRAEVLETQVDGLPVYLIGGAPIPPEAFIYSQDASVDGYKYTFFSLAALELARTLGWSPDILHANDWHSAPAVYALSLSRDPFFQNTASLLGVHNLPYLGVGAGPALLDFGLPPARGSALPGWAQDLPLPLGLLSADRIVAVSPTYAREILTPEFGSGLEGFLQTRAGSISGILNGLNPVQWDPAQDDALAASFSSSTLMARSANKLALVRELGLDPDPNLPLLAMVGRMDPQKGVDLVPPALRQIDSLPWQAVVLGTGVPSLEAAVQDMEIDYPGRVRAAIRFDPGLSRRIYAGADALLIPSRYEPCGLVQMIAMRYGCVPVARAVGGLVDTIRDFDRSAESTGFLFDEATSRALAEALRRALRVFTDPQAWQGLQRRGMHQDFSWGRSAREYEGLYRSLVEGIIGRQVNK